MLTAQEVDACASVKEIADLLPGNFFRREADTFLYNAMVGGKDDILRMLQGWELGFAG